MKRIKRLIIILGLLMLPAVLLAEEQIDLTAPVIKTDITYYKLSRLELDWIQSTIEIHLVFSPTGEEVIFGYSGQEAKDLMVIMNKKNFSTKSMHKTLFEKLIADGKIKGSTSGVPD